MRTLQVHCNSETVEQAIYRHLKLFLALYMTLHPHSLSSELSGRYSHNSHHFQHSKQGIFPKFPHKGAPFPHSNPAGSLIFHQQLAPGFRCRKSQRSGKQLFSKISTCTRLLDTVNSSCKAGNFKFNRQFGHSVQGKGGCLIGRSLQSNNGRCGGSLECNFGVSLGQNCGQQCIKDSKGGRVLGRGSALIRRGDLSIRRAQPDIDSLNIPRLKPVSQGSGLVSLRHINHILPTVYKPPRAAGMASVSQGTIFFATGNKNKIKEVCCFNLFQFLCINRPLHSFASPIVPFLGLTVLACLCALLCVGEHYN